MSELLCIDVGVTHTRTARWNGHELLDYRRQSTARPAAIGPRPDPDTRQAAWIASIADAVATARGAHPISRVAIAFPGIVAADGTIFTATGVWGAATHPVRPAQLSERCGVPVTVTNDLSAAVARYGTDPRFADRGYLMLLTISSGIGAKLYDVAARKVVLERAGRNGEIGLAIVDRSDERLGNDNGNLRGILGNYASGMGAARLAAHRAAADRASYERSSLAALGAGLDSIDRVELAAELAAGARAGDAFCRDVVGAAIDRLADVLHTVILFAAPDVIVLTGGFAFAVGRWYRDRLVDALTNRFTFAWSTEDLDRLVTWGMDDDRDALHGLARLAR